MTAIRKTLIGTVLSDKMEKTIVVDVSRRVRHPLFHKYYQKRKKYKAHDEKNECKVGDRVLLLEAPPISREKRWVVQQILHRAMGGVDPL